MDRKTPALLLTVILLGAAGGAAIWYLTAKPGTSDEARTPPIPEKPASTPSVAKTPGPVTAAPLQPQNPNTIDVSRSIRMPDGKYLPALNGVLNPPALGWPKDRPYSPVVGTERDTRGNDWYLHADGSKSTMNMIDMNRGGRVVREAVTQVANPQAALPVQHEESGSGSRPGGGTAR